MHRIFTIATAILAVAAPAAAAQTGPAQISAVLPNPVLAPSAQQAPNAARFTNSVHIPVFYVSAAACNRRTIGVLSGGNAMSVQGASDARTLIAVPLGGASIAAATTQQQISEVCDAN